MAVLTAATRRDTVFGNQKVAFVTFSAVSDGDTYATGYNTIDHVDAAAATSAALGYTASSGTITFKVSAGGPAVNAVIYGT